PDRPCFASLGVTETPIGETAANSSGSSSPPARAFGSQRPRPKRLPNAGIPGVLRHTGAQLGGLEYTTRVAGPARFRESRGHGDPLSERRQLTRAEARAPRREPSGRRDPGRRDSPTHHTVVHSRTGPASQGREDPDLLDGCY
ncbi:unnamed protein product, partial [Pleuronectes platessa]